MADKEVTIGNTTISENTKVSLSISTLAWVLGGLIFAVSSLFGVAYFDLKKQMDEQTKELQNTAANKEKVLVDKIEELHQKLAEEALKTSRLQGSMDLIILRTSRVAAPSMPMPAINAAPSLEFQNVRPPE